MRDILFAATRAPSGSNRQPFRFIVLTDGPVAEEAKRLIGVGARRFWAAKREADGYDRGSGAEAGSPKARMARTMQHYVDTYESVPVLILACYVPYRNHTAASDGASIYPACQNLLLAARALGYGGVMTGWQFAAQAELRELLHIPDEVELMATITIGRPAGPAWPCAAAAASRAGLRRSLGRRTPVGGRTRRGPPTPRRDRRGRARRVKVLRTPLAEG